MTNEYSGYQPAAGVWPLTDHISPDMAPEEFFSEYIAKRRPAVFAGSLIDEQWKGSQWTLPYLLRKAGATTVTVEDRPTGGGVVNIFLSVRIVLLGHHYAFIHNISFSLLLLAVFLLL